VRVATIDIGTNTVLLLVADRLGDGGLRAVAERAVVTRLGEGVDRTRRLAPAAVRRTQECLQEYARCVRELGAERVSVVGTSAMRDAGGGDEIRAQVSALLGVETRVLSGEDEARLTFRGAVGGLSIGASESGGDLAVFDIGGGSTEVVIGRMKPAGPRLVFGASYDVGSVRLTERHVVHDPPTRAERDALARAAEAAFASVPPRPGTGAPIGVAGTMTTLAAVSLGLAPYDGARVHGHTMSHTDLRNLVQELAAMNLEQRRRVPGMEPARADVIVAGGMVALALLDRWEAPCVRISDRGVRWGLAEELCF
jgi:exopolyphosphatase/guanosine-5'-triphosphate,3'-diphosphate pyrophosphatase